jgi:hypothetical protein
MSSSKDVRAGGAHVEIGVRDRLDKGLQSAAKRLRTFAKGAASIGAAVGGAGAAVAGPLLAMTARFLGNGDALSKMSDRTGVSVEALSELGYAATQSGASAEDLQGGFTAMSKMMLKGDEESKKTLATLDRMGVSFEELQTLSPEERFNRLADAIADVSDPTEQAALAARVFGGAGESLLPMLKEGADGMDELRQRARDLGLVMSGEDAAAATTLGDLWDDIGKIASRLGDIIGGALAPVLIPLADWFVNAAGAVAKWMDANRPLIVTIAKVAAVLMGVGAVITGIATAALGLSFVFSGLSAALGIGAAIMGAIGTVSSAVLSPIGLTVVAIVAATAAWFSFTATGKSTLDWIVSSLMGAWTQIQAVFGGITAALSSGEWALAAEIAWESIRLVFVNGVNAAAGILDMLSGTAGETFRGIAAALLNGDWSGAAAIAWESLKLAFFTGTASVTGAWDEFTTGLMIGLDSAMTWIQDKFQAAVGWIAKQLVQLWGLFDQDIKVDAVLQTLEEDQGRKRKQLQQDLESRNGQRAEALTKDLAATEARLAELRTARKAALDESAKTVGPNPLNADRTKLDNLLERANNLAGDAMNAATQTPPDKLPGFSPDQLAASSDKSSGLIGTFSGRNLGAAFGPDRVPIEQLQAAKAAVEQLASVNRVLHLMSRQKAVYGA